MLRFLLIPLSLLTLVACGFQPLYGTDAEQAGVAAQLADVSIDNIPDREGQALRNALIDRFYRHGRPASPRYALHVQPLRERLSDLDITKSSDATRGQLRLETVMTLKDAATDAPLLRRELVAITSYNILSSHFTTRVSEENARQNATDDLARQIETQLALYFRR